MNYTRVIIVSAAVTVLSTGAVQAGKGHGMADDNMQQPHGTPKQAGQQAMPMDGGGHGHASWPTPPDSYTDAMKYDGWTDPAAARRGQPIFEQQCAVCHGTDGRGAGPAAASLEHKPADLNKHFHTPGVQGDAYLFWRVTEGGQAEPFAGSGSMMPAFVTTLTEQQRWDVLTYLHQAFHDTDEPGTDNKDHEQPGKVHGDAPSHDK